ncbi:MAG: MerR family transcriptional regulator [Candidatus Eisenbacteria bacterium]|nr:MerR family transcriptional regulator [Candidatus Eisenbacteria bacterium]
MSVTPDKLYYSISEVGEATGVKAHVLRYWETQFSMLRPKKNRAGARMYRAKDVDLIREIKHLLYDRGFTIAGARRFLLDQRRAAEGEAAPGGESELAGAAASTKVGPALRQLRRELTALKEMLEAPPGTYRRRRTRDD